MGRWLWLCQKNSPYETFVGVIQLAVTIENWPFRLKLKVIYLFPDFLGFCLYNWNVNQFSLSSIVSYSCTCHGDVQGPETVFNSLCCTFVHTGMSAASCSVVYICYVVLMFYYITVMCIGCVFDLLSHVYQLSSDDLTVNLTTIKSSPVVCSLGTVVWRRTVSATTYEGWSNILGLT